ncbi:MAG: DNA polymerase III subunit beta [Planctomycetota bacterium]|nr:DNA polymerase III subunit beta [Planctomycetota bacterium]
MKISFDREEMSRALGLVCGVISGRLSKVILKNALFKPAGAGELELLSTNLDVGIRCRVRAKVEGEPVDVCLPAPAMLAEFRESQEKTGFIEIMPIGAEQPGGVAEEPAAGRAGAGAAGAGGGEAGAAGGGATPDGRPAWKATMMLGRDVFDLAVADAADFPEVPARSGSGGTKMPAEDLVRIVRRCIFAAGREEARYAINGVYMTVGTRGVEMVATDGRRMAVAKKKCKMKEWPAGVIVPTKVLAELVRALSVEADDGIRDEAGGGSREEAEKSEGKPEERKTRKKEEKGEKKKAAAGREVEIEVRDRTILFSTDGVTYSSTLIAGNFPRYEDIIPKSLDCKATFERRELEAALRKASHFVDHEFMTVRFEFAEGCCIIRSKGREKGSAKVTTNVECEGSPKEPLAFNPQFLLDVVGVLEGEKTTLEFADANRPAVIREGQDYVYVVMPLRA